MPESAVPDIRSPTTSQVYHHPEYYEIAFSFRDIPREVDLMERSIAAYSRIPVQNILEIGCGNSPHMLELLRRGYHYFGIDISPEMIRYSNAKAASIGQSVDIFPANMVEFDLPQRVDFAYVALGSLFVTSTAELISHFSSVSRALRPGGLYALDWCVQFSPLADVQESWEMEQDGIRVHTDVEIKLLNRIEQTFTEHITLHVDDHGHRVRMDGTCIRRAIFPQEFLFFLHHQEEFELIGWWNDWDLTQPLSGLEESINRPVTIVRKLQDLHPIDRPPAPSLRLGTHVAHTGQGGEEAWGPRSLQVVGEGAGYKVDRQPA